MDDDTKADAPLTPDEERALREAWASIGAWEPWDGQDEGATCVVDELERMAGGQ